MDINEFAKIVQFKRVDEKYYEVLVLGVKVGCVFYESSAWSYARWLIEGDRIVKSCGAYSIGYQQKLCGYRNRLAAAHHLAVMNSGVILSKLNNEGNNHVV